MNAAIFRYGFSVLALVVPVLTWAQGTGSAPLPPTPPSAGLSESGQLKLTLPELQARLALTAQQQVFRRQFVEFGSSKTGWLRLRMWRWWPKPCTPALTLHSSKLPTSSCWAFCRGLHR